MPRLKEFACTAIISLLMLSCNEAWLAAQTRAANSGPVQTTSTAQHISAITAALRRGDFALASTLSATAVRQYPQEPALWVLRGFTLSHTRHVEGALDAYKQALALTPDYLPALEGTAQLYYAEGDSRAIPLLRQILAAHAESATTHAMLAVLEYRQKDCAGAIADFQAALPAIAGSFEGLEQYGFCLVQLKQPVQAVAVLEQALNLRPASGAARLNVALAQMLEHENKPALATLQPLLTSAVQSNEALNLAAEIEQALDDIPATVALLRQAIALQPDDEDNYLNFAELSNRYGSYQAGVTILDAGIARLPNSGPLLVARGILLSQLYAYDKAMDDFERANRLDPNLIVAASAEGLIESQQRKGDAAIESYRKTLDARPDDPFTQYLLAEALSEKGYGPGSAGAREEIAAAKRAVELQPSLVAARDLLAGMYLQAGELDHSIGQSRAALEIRPNDQQAVYHLILALRRTDHRSEVAALVQRLAQLRKDAAIEQSHHTRYQITVAPDHGSLPPAP